MCHGFRVIACAVLIGLITVPCYSPHDPWSTSWLQQTLCQVKVQLFGQHLTDPEAVEQPSSWLTFVLQRGLAVLLLLSTTAYVTRNAATAKLLTCWSDKFALLLRVAVQLAICAELLKASSKLSSGTMIPAGSQYGPAGSMSPQYASTAGPLSQLGHQAMPAQVPAPAGHSLCSAHPTAGTAMCQHNITPAASGAAAATATNVTSSTVQSTACPALHQQRSALDGALQAQSQHNITVPSSSTAHQQTWRYSPQQMIAGTFLVNQLAFFTYSASSEVFTGSLELLPLCANLWRVHSGSSSSSSSVVGGSSSTLLSSSGNGGGFLRMLLLAVLSRVLLPLLVQHMLVQLERFVVFSRSSSSSSSRQQSVSGSRRPQGNILVS